MNIGETDADGWTYVRFGDAAKAAQEGAHDVETLATTRDQWTAAKGFWPDGVSLYRLREKQRTITVTIPRPRSMEKEDPIVGLVTLVYSTISGCKEAQAAVMRDYELCNKTAYQRAYCLDRAIVMNCSIRPGL